VLGLNNFSAYYDPAVGRLRRRRRRGGRRQAPRRAGRRAPRARRPRVLRARQRRLLLLSKFLMCNTSHYPSSHAVYQSSTQFIGLRLILFSKFLMCNTSHYSSSGGYNSKAVASLCYSTSCIAGHSIPS
jgi:hypothetical protein